MRFIIFLAVALCAHAADIKSTENAADSSQNKRQTHEGIAPTHLIYRTARKQQEQVAPVEEPQEEDKPGISRSDIDEYRPGQVISLNTQELLELQPERKAPLNSNQLLQQLYINPQQEHKQNIQYYYLEPQGGRQVSSHAVIARPHYSSNGGEASVGAALSVSDTAGTNPTDTFEQELLTLQTYSQAQQAQQASTVQSVAPQYQQVERYVAKPSKKPTKLRPKVPVAPQPPTAPQQYLIETTNVQQQQKPQQQQQQYRLAPQPQRVAQALRYIPFQLEPNEQAQLTEEAQQIQQAMYERPEPQGLKIIPAPNLQQTRSQLSYRFVPQYQQTEAPLKQYRIPENQRPQPVRQDVRFPTPNTERPVAYLKRYPEPDKMRAVKIYEPIPEGLSSQAHQPGQLSGDQYTNYLRSVYRTISEHRLKAEQSRVAETTKPPHSAIYVSKNVFPRKPTRPLPLRDQNVEQLNIQQVNNEQNEQDIEDERARLPPPKNNKAYTPEEFAALVAAGYSVTPVPVGSVNLLTAQSRSSVEPVLTQPKRRLVPSRRHQYLPLRGDDAP